VHGTIWDLVKGDNYVTVDSGYVLGEIVTPVLSSTTYYINDSTLINSLTRNKNEVISTIYRNQIANTWTIDTTNPYGVQRASLAQASYDVNATYTVDYQILKTLHAQSFGGLTLEYYQSVLNAIDGLNKIVETKQAKDSALDSLVDRSYTEDKTSTFCVWRAVSTTTGYIDVIFPFVATKRTIPKITIKSYTFTINNSANTTFTIDSVSVRNDMAVLVFKTTDTTTVSNIKLYGASASVRAVFECTTI
jgi:hypothetical protein